MKKILFRSLIISVIGVFIIDYFSHSLFSNPMETSEYFFIKMIAFFIFSVIALKYINFNKNELQKVIICGVVISSLWGMYYNVFPVLFDYYPYGITLSGLSFLGFGLFGTGLSFGIVHTLSFIGGYYAERSILNHLSIN